VDHAAHEAALDAGGKTIAVLGCGVDRPWPAGPLAERMALEGLLVSEYEPGREPRPHHFPLRNRIISGLADGVLVIEAAQAWALPGRVDHPHSRGTHRLLRDGATLVEDPEEIVRELLGTAPAERERAATLEELQGLEQQLVAALEGETLSSAELVERVQGEAVPVLATLVELELRGLVLRGPGGLWRRL
jgi:DNA processing protein